MSHRTVPNEGLKAKRVNSKLLFRRVFYTCSLMSKLTSVSYASVRTVIDHEFRQNILKVAVDPRGDS